MLRHYYNNRDEGEIITERRPPLDEPDEDYDEDLALLYSFSLVAKTTNEGEFETHGLVQFATRVWLSSTDAEEQWRGKFVAAMANAFPLGEYENWPICRVLLPHVQSVVEKKPLQGGKSREWTRVLTNAGWYAWRQALLSQAQDLIQTSLGECERSFELNDSSTLLNVNHLGSILQMQDNMKQQRRCTDERLPDVKRSSG